jgi:hypothetical protein
VIRKTRPVKDASAASPGPGPGSGSAVAHAAGDPSNTRPDKVSPTNEVPTVTQAKRGGRETPSRTLRGV